MQSVMTLYRSHDEDLLALYETVGIREFGRLLKESLRVLARPDYIPKYRPPSIINPYTGDVQKRRFLISIRAKKDADIEELLSHVKERRMGAFCKMALRFYLGPKDVMSSMLNIRLVSTLSYVPTGYIVASTPSPSCVRDVTAKATNQSVIATAKVQNKPEPSNIDDIDSTDSQIYTKDTVITALPMQIIPSRSLEMTTGDTVVMTEADEQDEDDVLALLESLMD